MTTRSSSAEGHGNVEGGPGTVTFGDGVFSATDLAAGVTAPRYRPHEGPLLVLVGKARFSEHHAWSEMPLHWPSRVADRRPHQRLFRSREPATRRRPRQLP
jgi:hypothetical protein